MALALAGDEKLLFNKINSGVIVHCALPEASI